MNAETHWVKGKRYIHSPKILPSDYFSITKRKKYLHSGELAEMNKFPDLKLETGI